MWAFLWSFRDHVWYLIDNGWIYPIKIIVDNTVIPKSMIEWNKEECKGSKWNNKGFYAIIRVVISYKNQRIQRCPTSK